MSKHVQAFVDVDWDRFDPWRIQPVRHRLMAHPLMQFDALVALGQRLETVGRIRTHSSDATPGTSFNAAPRLHPNARSATETLRQIGDAQAWMSLLNVQTDPLYRTLVDDVLDGLRPHVETRDPGMCFRGGWIFITSPNTVTPFHFDKEHNFILQVSGKKKLYVWDHRDLEAASEQARDQFHLTHERDLLQWRDSLRTRAQVFELEPGQGAYMPSTSPHMVENGDGPSVTISFTYYTDATRRDSLLHRTHGKLRRLGITPPAVGSNRAWDAVVHAGVSALSGAREQARRLLGRKPRSDRATYAHTALH